MRGKLVWAVVFLVCVSLCVGILGAKAKKSPAQVSVTRADLTDRLGDSREEGTWAVSKAGSRLVQAQDLIAAGASDEAINVLNTIVRMDLPATREADKLVAEAYVNLGGLYHYLPDPEVRKAIEFYGLAIERADVGEDAHFIAHTIRTVADIYLTLGDVDEVQRLEGIAQNVESGMPPTGLNLAPRTSSSPLELLGPGDDTCDVAVPVTLPHSEIMSIFPAGDHNWRSYDLSTPSLVRIETISADTFGDDTDLTLWGGCSGSTPTDFIAFDDDSGPGFLSLIETPCLDVGTYYVEVGGFNDTATPDDFELAITVIDTCIIPTVDEFEPDDELSAANRIGFRNNGVGEGNQFGRDNKNIQQHSIFPTGDVDYVTSRLSRANFVRIETLGGGSADTVIGLTTADGALIAVNDDKEPGDPTSKLEMCLDRGDWYVVTLPFLEADVFGYEIAVDVEFPCLFETEPNGTFAQANAIDPGETIWGLQTFAGLPENDFYVFTLDEESLVTLETGGYDEIDVDTFLELYDDSGALLASDDDGGPGFLSKIVAVLPMGTYFVNSTISPFDADLWIYSLTLTLSEAPLAEIEPNDTCGTANPVALGDALLASINPVGDRDNFLLTVPADGFVEVETSGPSGDTVLKVSSADGTEFIGCDDDGGDGLFSKWGCCLPAGDWCVTVREFGDNSTISTYSVEFRDLGTCVPGDPLGCPSAGLGCPF